MSNKTNDRNSSTQPKRRWLNIGPGIVIALAISCLIGVRYIKTEIAARQKPGAPPIVERQIVTSSYEEKLGPTPEVSFIIDRAEKLHVTDAQSARLRALQEKWQKHYGPKIAQANKAAANTNKYMANAKGNARTPTAQIRNAAAPLIALSGEISSARRSYWNQAANILTADQRRILQDERKAAWTKKTRALSSKG